MSNPDRLAASFPIVRLLGVALPGCALAGRASPAADHASHGRSVDGPFAEHHPPLATTQPESGRADPNLPMERIILVLKSSPEQEADLEHLIVDQQDPASLRYHRWLSPEEFGLEFGRAGGCRCRDPVLPGSRAAGRIGRPRPPHHRTQRQGPARGGGLSHRGPSLPS